MKQFFILGRNPELSKTEIIEFLKAREKTHKEILFEKNILILETSEEEKLDIQEFGGTLHLGKIISEGANEQILKYIDENEIVPADKFSYTVLGNQNPEILKNKFKSEKKKAIIKHSKKQIKFQNGKKQEFPKVDFYILYHSQPPTTNCQLPTKVYLGIADQNYDNTEIKKRDMQKPTRRESLAISPRLSKILINLSGAKPNDLLLDPFCGIGGILQEALIKKINAHGVDKDKSATENAEKNLKWLTQKYKIENTYKIENKNSQNISGIPFTTIATEAPLGKLLRKKPTDKEAKQIILDFEAHIIPILKHLKKIKNPSTKIAITFPIIQNFHTDAEKIAEKTELKIYLKPIQESRPNQFISRDILVLQ
ncbi:MAG: hypothetical protein V1889_01910 [archaeon]